MATTTYLSLAKPSVGSTSGWGVEINDNYDLIDEELSRLNDLIVGGTSAAQGAYPVGSIFIAAVATNPATLLGFGTWAPFAEGRAIVGVGTADSVAWANEQTRGAAERTIGVNQLPSHTHTVASLTAASAGLHSHAAGTLATAADVNNSGAGNNINAVWAEDVSNRFVPGLDANPGRVLSQSGNDTHDHALTGDTAQAGAHSHSITGTIDNTGGGEALNILQPSIGVYMWKRTA